MEYFATKYRPKTFDDVVGQTHLVSKHSSLRRMVESNKLFNMIFYGNPGCGKTTIANIIATTTNRKFVKLNAVDLSVKEIKEELAKSLKEEEPTILLIDEIHLLNKKQQQSLLDATENGKICLIGILPDNPYFCLHNALLSRSVIFQFHPVTSADVEKRLWKVLKEENKEYPEYVFKTEEGLISSIAQNTNGDIRSALNILQILLTKKIDLQKLLEMDEEYKSDSNILLLEFSDLNDIKLGGYHDKDGDNHYNTLSAFHKSLRGSDENAAIHYLARLIVANDIQGIIRRLLCVASEDVGLANPQAIVVTKACVDTALQLGFPEARLPLAEATIFLARQPKSNSVISAIDLAIKDVKTVNNCDIPEHLKDGHYSGAKNLNKSNEYKYPHDYKNNWVQQTYLPKAVSDRKYYVPGDNKTEKAYEDAWRRIKK